MTKQTDQLVVAAAQVAPVWLDRNATIRKVLTRLEQAADQSCDLVAFGEALVPGYPLWIERTDGARFDSKLQKRLHSHYLDQAVQIEAGHLDAICEQARKSSTYVVLGCIERPLDRGGHSLYASCVSIGPDGEILSVHRKLMPTYEERLTWAAGDGHGLRTHALGAFTVGALNCWENWMPLTRTALYGMGEDLHVAIWPGSVHNTQDITRFIARESRSYVISASAVCGPDDIPTSTPHREEIVGDDTELITNGGSCIAGPDAEWILEPLPNEEGLLIAEIDHGRVREERQNFDPVGHYSRPDVLRLVVNRERQRAVVDSAEEDQH